MQIDLHKIKIREVVNGYKDSAEEGVVAYGGKLEKWRNGDKSVILTKSVS